MVNVNTEQCNKIGNALKNITIKKEFIERPYIINKYDKKRHIHALYFSVAICHQTYDLKHKKANIYGWDVFEKVFCSLMDSNSELLDPDFIIKVSNKELESMLLCAFSENSKAEDSTLDDIENRSKLYKNAALLISNLCKSLDEQLNELPSIKSIYRLLSKTEAYSDPHRKKSSLFIKFVFDAGYLKESSYEDMNDYIPIMDYHMQRVLLRTGCVLIEDYKYFDTITKRESQKSDEPIRSKSIDAMRIIAESSGHSIASINDYFWTLGRSCCEENPLCISKQCAKTPCSFEEVADLSSHDKCVFHDDCLGAADENYRNLWQPVVKTHFY